MGAWLPYVMQVGEALVVALAAYLGAIPGIPAGDWKAALSLGIAKVIPPGITTTVTGLGKKA